MVKGGHFTLLKVDWSPEIIGGQARNSLEKTTCFWPIQHLQNPKIPKKKPSEKFCIKIVISNLFNMFSELRPCRGFSGGRRVTEKPGVAGPTKLLNFFRLKKASNRLTKNILNTQPMLAETSEKFIRY